MNVDILVLTCSPDYHRENHYDKWFGGTVKGKRE